MSTRNDRDLDNLLGDNTGQIGAAYRKLSRAEPPRRLDRNVLAEATRAVHGRPRSSIWLLGAGTAAGVLLAAGIAWRVNHDMVQQRESMPMSSPAAEAAPSDVIRVEPREKAAEGAVVDEQSALPEQPSFADDTAKTEPSASGAVAQKRDASDQRKAAKAKQELDDGFVPDPAIRKDAAKPASEIEMKLHEIQEQSEPAPMPASPAPPAAAPMMESPPAQSRALQSMREVGEKESVAMPEPMPQAEDMRQNAADRAASMQSDSRRERASSTTNAEVIAEIDRIRALLRSGQRESAIEALRELRRQHPDVVLPADLRSLDG